MRTSSSQTLEGFLRNPSILAMIGSVGIHSMLVLFSGLKPAESVPTPLQVISLNPGSDTTNLNALLAPSGLPVPNGLPPINLGEVPELSNLPNGSPLGNPSSQSVYLSSDPSSINFGSLSVKNPPQKSVAGAQGPVVGINLPKRTIEPAKDSQSSSPSGAFAGNRPLSEQLQAQRDNAKYAVNPNQGTPKLNPGTFQPDDGGTSSTAPSSVSSSLPSPLPSSTAATGDSAAPLREKYNGWLQAKGQAYGQPISTQTGPRLTAEYPPSACNTKVDGSAFIAAVFGPDGAIAPGSDSVQVLQSAETLALTRAAISTVEGYRFPASGIHQAYNFRVDVPYSATACTAKSSPDTPIKPSASPTITPTKPSAIPSPSAQKATSKEDFLRRLESSNSQVKSSQAPSPSLTPSPSPEPLPSPSIAVPEGTPKSP
jgi:hypothetical protein